MPNTNPGDPYDRTNYPGSTPDPLNPPEGTVVQPNSESYDYAQGRAVERQRNATVQQVRDENNTANGFLIGILLTGLVLGGAALAYFATQRNLTPATQRTIIVPSASPSPSPEVKERVIERDRIVPVPQPQQSAPTVIPAPNVTIEAPKPSPVAPAPQASPATPSKQQPESSSPTQPKSAEPAPSPEATTSPNPSGSGQ